ncbi:hypothetical protein B4O97_17135 [Marispirochaeta aestuarii]|uniref:Uncharacterized protein n=1 Tax=Marispirochaeta aestuarii TaxID=1963862 RepID=A0A1Y1RTW4_9SPIO|nr:RHS repeat-associated core domain-containing protein [Marispirochaeta aestuarii]ORC31237.1 hypothetical protein B4O97_17135 [Marispirochaeta aestuarii]
MKNEKESSDKSQDIDQNIDRREFLSISLKTILGSSVGIASFISTKDTLYADDRGCADYCGGDCITYGSGGCTCDGDDDSCNDSCDDCSSDYSEEIAEAQEAIAAAEEKIEDAQAAYDEAIAAGDERAVQAARDEIRAAEASREEAAERVSEAEAKQREAKEAAAQFRAKLAQTQNQANSTVTGDPVRIATGVFHTEVTDLSIPYLGSNITLQRQYESDKTYGKSFGTGWNFSYDTRIILGVDPDAAETAELLTGFAETQRSDYYQRQTGLAGATSSMNTAKTKVDAAQATIAAALQSAQTALAKARASHSSSLIAQAQALVNQISGSGGLTGQAAEVETRVDAVLTELADSDATLEELDTLCVELENLASDANDRNDYASAAAERNLYVTDGNEPPSFLNTGNGTCTWVDQSGVPHYYTLDKAPDYSSDVQYTDGSRNYFPQGALGIPQLPIDDVLHLNSHGTWTLVRKDLHHFEFSFLGLLSSISDANNNQLACTYSKGLLSVINDDFGRTIRITRSGKKISAIISPEGYSISFSYNLDGMLASVTDPEGDTISYEYDGSLLTAIVKPDGKRRRYIYESLSGTMVVSQAIDEEGMSEYFRYYPASGYSEYENASGIVERHYYNERKLETKVEYGDGGTISMEYDENNNLIKRTNEVGETYHFTYDGRRNLIESIDPQGHAQKWTYNDIDKVSSYTDRLGRTTGYTYDSKGNLIVQELPDGAEIHYEYNDRGQRTKTTDPRGNSTLFRYDSHGYPASETSPDGTVRRFKNDLTGNILEVTDQAGYTTTYTYRKDKKLVCLTDPEGNTETYEYNKRKDLVAKTDKRGNRTEFTYDGRHLLIKATNPLGETAEYSYRADGRMIQKLIDKKSTTSYTYDSRGNLASVTQLETNSTVRYEYDAAQRLTKVTDPNGNATWYDYTLLGDIAREENALGNIRSFTYDAEQNRTYQTDFAGNTTEYRYDVRNRLTELIDPDNKREQYTYDLTGNRTAVIDKNGNTTVFEYDALNRLIKQTDPLNNTIRYEYEPRGLVSKRTDRNGGTVLFAYNSLGTIVTATDPAGNTIETTYNETSQPRTRKDRNGNITAFEYDSLNRLIITRDPYGHETRRSYNYLGLVAAITDPLGNTRTFDHDPAGRLVKTTDPLGGTKQYTYDPAGNLISYQDEMKRETGYTYDQLNRLKSSTNALGENYSYTYDVNGNLIRETDPEGSAYQYEYDKLNRLKKEINRLGAAQTYTRDPVGNLLSKTDFNGDLTAYTYDPVDRLINTSFADGSTKIYSYDAEGNLTSAENPEKQLAFSYDPVNRLSEVYDSSVDDTVRYTYDAEGNRLSTHWNEGNRTINRSYGKANELLTVTDPDGTTTAFTYDALLRETECKRPNDVVTETVYDPAGRITSIKNFEDKHWRDTLLSSFAYLYNAAGERRHQIDEEGNIETYQYDAVGRIAEAQYPFNSGKPAEDFDQRLRFGLYPEEGSSSSHNHGHGHHNDERYTFNLPRTPDNDFINKLKDIAEPQEEVFRYYRKKKKDYHPRWRIQPGDGATRFAARLSLDQTSREQLRTAYQDLTGSRRHFDADPWVWTENFTYDSRNNLTSKANGWGAVPFSYNAANELTQAGERTYTHDANGNLTREALNEVSADYSYTPENRIEQIETEIEAFMSHHCDGETGVRYTYDSLGRRSSRTAYTTKSNHGWHNEIEWNKESNQSYLYDGLSFNVLAELKDTQFRVDTHGRTHRRTSRYQWQPVSEYLYGNGSRLISKTAFATNERFGNRYPRHTDTDYYLQDVLGSVVGITDERGNQTEAYSFDVWGNHYDRPNQTNSTHTDAGWNALPATLFGFNGKKFDPKVGLYDYGFRDYKPAINRWTTIDPIRAGKNWYAYVENDPVNWVDLWGLLPEVGGTGQVDDPLERAIIDNLDFDEPGSKCDEFCTEVMDDAGLTPNDWPDPDDYKVGENPEDIPNYIDHYSSQTQDVPNTGANAVMMETGHPAEHMGIVDVEEDGSISGAHYSGGEVEQFEYDNQNDFEDAFVYEDFHYLPLE